MDAKTIIEMEKQFVAHTYARADFVLARGEGCWLWDTTGKRYLDAGAGIAVNALGYGDPAVIQALQAGAEGLIHLSNLYHHPAQALLAQQLTAASFAGKVFFCNSGAEANEAALKFARKVAQANDRPQQTEFLAFEHAFHGRTMGALSVTYNEKYRLPYAPLIPGVKFAPFNNSDAAMAAIDSQTAAVIVEPIQGEGGVHPASPEFLQALRRRCDATGTLLIFDEVQCGLGRSGKLWAYQHAGVEPDMLTVAKPLAGGLPIGAVIMKEKVASCLQPGDHGSTFGGGPLICSVASVVLQKINQPDFLETVRAKGEYLRSSLIRLQQDVPAIQQVRGQGLLVGLQVTLPAAQLVQTGYRHGLLAIQAGGNVLRLIPPLIISNTEIDQLLEKLRVIFSDKELKEN
jgi:acetylornithine/N-succinyldiaminopimelate aminotransferase